MRVCIFIISDEEYANVHDKERKKERTRLRKNSIFDHIIGNVDCRFEYGLSIVDVPVVCNIKNMRCEIIPISK